MNERVAIGGAVSADGASGPIGEAVDGSGRPAPGPNDPCPRDRPHAAVDRGRGQPADQHAGQPEPRRWAPRAPRARSASWPSPSSTRRSTSFAVDLMGAEGMLYGSYEMTAPDTAMVADGPQKAFLRARANSIEGGTSEIMRNILGERVLGLPGDVRVDKDRPWSEVPRS